MSKQEKVQEALAKIYNKAPKENFMAIEYDYNKALILPYEDGLKFWATLKNAETLHTPYSKPATITGFDTGHFKSRVFSRKEYEDIKVAAMLGITVEELNTPEEEPVPF